jgi:hypothetical protein
LLAWPSHKLLLPDARPFWAAFAHVLALVVVLAHPVASLTWLSGTHATPEQVALHDAAVEHGYYHHHGSTGHHEHQPGGQDGKTDARFSRVTAGTEFTPAAPHAATSQDLLQAALAVVPQAFPPDGPPRYAATAGIVPSQHSPPVPHRPPILLCSTFAFL